MLGHKQETTTVKYLDLHRDKYAEAIQNRFAVAEVVAASGARSDGPTNIPQSLPTVPTAPPFEPARM